MSLLAMPFLVINFGGEMIYILEQRLHAQNIASTKSGKVLQDVARAMFNPKFITELMKPQLLYDEKSTREIFDRLAHSSIMRLSESSMDKLYDLMTMGFKYQLLSCQHPRELVAITLNHLEAIRDSVSASEQTVAQLNAAIEEFVKLCKELSTAEFAQIHEVLLNFFQNKKIKVSLFLQDGIQNSDGTISLKPAGPIPNDVTVAPPGTIKYFDGETVSSTENFQYPLADKVGERQQGDVYDPKSRDSKLGQNLYTLDRSKKKEAAKAAKTASSAASTKTSTQKLKEAPKGAVMGELKSLRELLGAPKVDKPVELNLFPSSEKDAGPATSEIVICKITREEMEKTNETLVGIVKDLNLDDGADGGKEQDLLDMLDQAA
eukprot:TRINITY_DN11794_c0_g1_i1.p1 TRINITY_DN11794_c0_g1~~TRINITY_DN11794_c0_g1_i1.p1  ORF type:complete len:377 (-),score=50.37 TRINITY_DN11794_c0_g1_i1:141-1271(-)